MLGLTYQISAYMEPEFGMKVRVQRFKAKAH